MAPRSPYIGGPVFDYVLIIFAPLVSLLIGLAIRDTSLTRIDHRLGLPPHLFAVEVISFAHLFLVFLRSHGRGEIFARHPLRFTVAPILLVALLSLSLPALLVALVLLSWWDQYHQCMQNFGLGRIYDAKAGIASDAFRRHDLVLNVCIYLGPLIAGSALIDHLVDFENFALIGMVDLAQLPTRAAKSSFLAHASLATGVLSAAYVAYYLVAMRRRFNRGEPISREKVMLILATSTCSIIAWRDNSFSIGIFITSLYHAVQYFALVWTTEHRRLLGAMRLPDTAMAKSFLLGVFLAVPLGLGLLCESHRAVSIANQTTIALIVSLGLLHFWFDGFVWSVGRRQVA
ncbi:MAG TPA: hypothetical protein VEL07_16195 [Planctomycetota bacterium]|nr:hypothetical protein [Planctomycetota bacterium]